MGRATGGGLGVLGRDSVLAAGPRRDRGTAEPAIRPHGRRQPQTRTSSRADNDVVRQHVDGGTTVGCAAFMVRKPDPEAHPTVAADHKAVLPDQHLLDLEAVRHLRAAARPGQGVEPELDSGVGSDVGGVKWATWSANVVGQLQVLDHRPVLVGAPCHPQVYLYAAQHCLDQTSSYMYIYTMGAQAACSALCLISNPALYGLSPSS